MPKILFVNACVRENSRTLELAESVMTTMSGEREDVNLYEIELSPLGAEGLTAREKASDTKDFSDSAFNLPKQFAKADIIVIAAPYWDLMFPAVLKSYIETITVNGLTFVYNDYRMSRN